MAATTFDTLYYAKKLREAGFTEQQAEAQAEALRAVVDENLATKRDLKELEVALRHEMELLRQEIKQSESRVTIRLGALIVAAVVVLAALMKLL